MSLITFLAEAKSMATDIAVLGISGHPNFYFIFCWLSGHILME